MLENPALILILKRARLEFGNWDVFTGTFVEDEFYYAACYQNCVVHSDKDLSVVIKYLKKKIRSK